MNIDLFEGDFEVGVDVCCLVDETKTTFTDLAIYPKSVFANLKIALFV